MSAVSTFHTIKHYNHTYTGSIQESQPEKTLSEDMEALYPELAFVRSRLALASDDSITLSVNLHDSLLTLEYKGVVLHQAPILSIGISDFFQRLKPVARFNLFAEVMKIERALSTISHEPLIYRKAPKDTLEAQQTNITPDTNLREPVFVAFYMENGIRLELTQNDPVVNTKYRKTIRDIRKRTSGDFVRSILLGKIPEYQPWIRIQTSWRDARTIYRALPKNGKISVYYP
ncbi:MAG: hypothetical protein KKA81_04190 [Bacteroidetes bacterium]|nr:hypothetical protein [Bacteroidota bacterium]